MKTIRSVLALLALATAAACTTGLPTAAAEPSEAAPLENGQGLAGGGTR